MKTVQDILDGKGRDFIAVAADLPVQEAARLMAEQGIGSLLVMRDDALLGLISERDVAYKLVCVGTSCPSTSSA